MEHVTERKVGDLTVRIDRTICVGFGDCVTAAPQAFEQDAEGIAELRAEADAVDRERLLEACAACPVDAIIVLDAEGNQLVPRTPRDATPAGKASSVNEDR